MVMIESLAHGTPVVVTPWGAAPEIVDDGITGFIRSGVEALVDAVGRAKVLDRAACRAAVVERFSIQRMTSEHTAFYTAQVEEHGRGLLAAGGFGR